MSSKQETMQAIIIATGENQKLAPLTNTLPTPMIPVANQPVMTYPVELLSRFGIKSVFVSLHHLSGSIESYFNEGRRWGVQFEYILQKDPLGNGGAVRWASTHIKKPLLVFSGDQLLDVDLEAVIDDHKQSGAAVTMLVSKINKQGQTIAFTADGNVSTNNLSERFYSTSFFILEPEVIDLIPHRKHYRIEDDLLPQLLANGLKLNLVENTRYWNPISSFQQYAEAQQWYLDSATAKIKAEEKALRYPSMGESQKMGSRVWAGRNYVIHPTVRIFPPVSIGDNCQIGRDVVLGPYTVIGSNVIIDDEASLVHSTVLANTYIGKLVNIEQKFISHDMMVDPETSKSLEIVDRFLIGEAHPSLVNSDFRRFVHSLLATILIILLSPLLVLVGLLTLLTTGKIFSKSTKVGTLPRTLSSGGRREPATFSLLNFATSRGEAKTGLGRWLEKSAIHRLPELFNVVIGTIGLVGVKPLTPNEAEQIVEEWQQKRFEYMPGFTGLWHVQSGNNITLDEIIISDVYYVATRTWREDMKLLWRTLIQWWR